MRQWTTGLTLDGAASSIVAEARAVGVNARVERVGASRRAAVVVVQACLIVVAGAALVEKVYAEG